MATFDRDEAAKLARHLHSHLPSDPALRTKTLESLLVERGLVASETIDAWVEAYSEHIGPKRGAQVVARAWVDDGFRTAAVGDAAGTWAAVIDRARPGGADRVSAATEILDFNGWDVSRIQRVEG